MITLQRIIDFFVPTPVEETDLVVSIDGDLFHLENPRFGLRDYDDGGMRGHLNLEVGEEVDDPARIHHQHASGLAVESKTTSWIARAVPSDNVKEK